jgi:alpha-D-ribose 1-methylphosphonate 5-triphosphate synthase subunit PhnH
MGKESNFHEVHDAQSQFRIIMDAMARPGKINLMDKTSIEPPTGFNKASGIIGFSLLNADVSFYVLKRENKESISEYISLNTQAAIASIDTADFIFLQGKGDSSALYHVKKGSLSYPENSASIIIDATKISYETESEGSTKIVLKGPGIESSSEVFITGIDPLIFETTKDINAEFPLGIDLIFTDTNGFILCIPRSNQFEFIQN